MQSPGVLLVHERFTERGGSEKVVDTLARMWPTARLFAPIIDDDVCEGAAAELDRTTSRIQSLYPGRGRYSHLLPLMPRAMRDAPSLGYDVAILSHHAFANRVRLPAGIPSISYVHTPARWMWNAALRRADAPTVASRAALALFAASQRRADRAAALRPDVLVANSSEVASRIRRWWGRDSVVVHPPVGVARYQPKQPRRREDFFLLAGRLVPYKRPDIAIRAATAAGVRLVVAGDGRFRERCEAMAGPTVEFVGSVSDDQLADLYQRCAALVFAGVEDFGMVPVEAQAGGAPVIGVDVGGLRDTVIPGVTGVLVPDSSSAGTLITNLATALVDFDRARFDSARISGEAERFAEHRFESAMRNLVDRLLAVEPQQRRIVDLCTSSPFDRPRFRSVERVVG